MKLFINQSDHILTSHLQLSEKCEKGRGIWRNNSSIYGNKFFKPEFNELWNFWKFSKFANSFCPITFWEYVKASEIAWNRWNELNGHACAKIRRGKKRNEG